MLRRFKAFRPSLNFSNHGETCVVHYVIVPLALSIERTYHVAIASIVACTLCTGC